MKVLSLFDGISCGMVALERAGINVECYDAYEIDKNAIKVSQKNYPQIVHHGDVCTADFTQYKGYDLIIGGSPCLAGDTLVLTSDGYKPIVDVKVGDKVLSYDGLYHNVTNWFNQGVKKTYRIKGMAFDEIRATSNHKFYVRIRQKDGTFGNPEWKTVAELMETTSNGKPLYKNCRFGMPYNTESCLPEWKGVEINVNQTKKKIINNLDLNNETFWYICGRWLGDGWFRHRKGKFRKDGGIVICCAKYELEDFKSKIGNLFHYSVVEERTVYKLHFSNVELAAFLHQFGKGADGKFIPGFALHLPINLLSALVKGYYESDGNKRANGDIKVESIDRILVYGVSQCSLKCGLKSASIHKTNRPPTCLIENRIVNQRDTYEGYFKVETTSRSHSFIEDNIFWYPIKLIEEYGEENVYDIEVSDVHSFVANNAISHNCQGFSQAGKGLNFEDPRSKLFFEFVRAIKEVQPKYFLLENVVMKKEWQDVISQQLGVEPIMINSSLVSAQNRRRLYWTNIPNVCLPEDKGITFGAIREHNVPNNNDYYTEKAMNWIHKHEESSGNKLHLFKDDEKMQCLEASMYKKYSSQRFFGIEDTYGIRYITVTECERCQTLPDGYTAGIANTNRYKALGNGWTVDVIAHILRNLKV